MRSFFIFSTFLTICFSYKILIFSNLFGHSHVKLMGTIADILTDSGHNVTVLMSVMDPVLKSRNSLKSTKQQIYVDASPDTVSFMEWVKSFLEDLWHEDGASNPLMGLVQGPMMSSLFGGQCREVLKDQKLIEKLKGENFDLGIAEPFNLCGYAVFEAIKIRAHVAVIASSRLEHVSSAIGQPAAPSYVPATESSSGAHMSFWQRLNNFIHYICGGFAFAYPGDAMTDIAREYYPNIRSWRETLPEASFLFTNSIPILEFPSPTLDKIIPIGGITVKTIKKELNLEEKWDNILGLRKNNVFISFGSNVKSMDMPKIYKDNLLKVFNSMPDTSFIWKYENEKDNFTSSLDNVYLGEWLPQNELLADPRLTLFITHGGLGSVTEVSYMGKPCIVIPMFADQARNAQMLKRHGGAEILDKTDLQDFDIVRKALNEVISDKKYRENAERLAEMLNNQPNNPRDTLVKYVEFAARFGKLPTLDPIGRSQSFVVYYLFDVITFIVLSTILMLYIVIKVSWLLINFCRRARKLKSQ